ncbi:MAG TPA: DUF4159 domain-containing protein [SAR324 cluster bacterium]|jgi:hypothetical protein|nr:hypothetical protein [Deltaproteobacteria bacterium]MAD99999.1 hypothetical protein [Pseudomonadota bacterium]MDP6090493.1 DUF4159 domain-containing protein [SAR324 cluster bacterium]MDP7335465.1 DUF4159 domain-containing protein [SAR324 cluster bacterium]HJM04986.1 DUF4159 domain-containing protein [SAR324 cluster bacterium]|tara:strand:+ start:1092 stop:1895 length:804 start_codon:yes stop_codon:yes gene_type:complete
MRPSKGSLFIGLLWSFLYLPNTVAQQNTSPAPKPPATLKQLKQSISDLDRLEWMTLSFNKKLLADQSIQRIRKAVEGRTTLILHPLQRFINFDTKSLNAHPFFHLEMCVPAPKMDWETRFRWRDYFNSGGTLFLDACPVSKISGDEKNLYRSWKDWGRMIFPGTGWSPLNRKHALSFSFYLLEKRMLLGREGSPFSILEHDGRVILLHNQSRRWSWHTLKSKPVTAKLNPPNVEIHLRLFINLLMLLFTGDYKQDQLHLPTILLRRR